MERFQRYLDRIRPVLSETRQGHNLEVSGMWIYEL